MGTFMLQWPRKLRRACWKASNRAPVHVCHARRQSQDANQRAYERMLANKARVSGHFIPPAPDHLPPLDPTPLTDFLQRYLSTLGQPPGTDPQAELEGPPVWTPPAHITNTSRASTAASYVHGRNGKGAGDEAEVHAGSGGGGGSSRDGLIIPPPAPLAGSRHVPLPRILAEGDEDDSEGADAMHTTHSAQRLALAPAHAGPVYLFWDLESLHPGRMDPRLLAGEVMRLAQSAGYSMQGHQQQGAAGGGGTYSGGLYVYSVRQGFSWVPSYFLEAHAPARGSMQAQARSRVPRMQSSSSSNRFGGSSGGGGNTAASMAGRNTDRASLGRIRQYHSSSGTVYVPTQGHQLSIKYVLGREGFEPRLVQNADEAVDRAINGGIDKLLYTLRMQPIKASAAAGGGGGRAVLLLLSDSARHAAQLVRCRDMGMRVVVVGRQGQAGGSSRAASTGAGAAAVGDSGSGRAQRSSSSSSSSGVGGGGGSGSGSGSGLDALRPYAHVVLDWELLASGAYDM